MGLNPYCVRIPWILRSDLWQVVPKKTPKPYCDTRYDRIKSISTRIKLCRLRQHRL